MFNTTLELWVDFLSWLFLLLEAIALLNRLNLVGLLLTVILLDFYLSFSISLDRYLTRQVKLSRSDSSFSLALLIEASDLLHVSLESFVGSSSEMTSIACKSFSTVIAFSYFSVNFCFIVHFTNCAMLSSKAKVY